MPQHRPNVRRIPPVLEFCGWLVSVACRPIVPLIELAEWFGIALLDAFAHRTRWLRRRLASRWPWQATVATALLACAVVTVVSYR